MFTALIATLALNCKPYPMPRPPPPPPTFVVCEGVDQVRRRVTDSTEVSRWRAAPACMPAPVRLTTEQPIRFGLSSRG